MCVCLFVSFYDYWGRFESWRDFSLKAAEFDLEEAGSREEKRWMQKENDKRCVSACVRVCLRSVMSLGRALN